MFWGMYVWAGGSVHFNCIDELHRRNVEFEPKMVSAGFPGFRYSCQIKPLTAVLIRRQLIPISHLCLCKKYRNDIASKL